MAFIIPSALDALINTLKGANALYVCSREPVSYTEAIATFALANKTGLAITGPVEGATPGGGGRRLIIPAFTQPGGCTANGTGTFYALVNTSTLQLLFVMDLNPFVPCSVGDDLRMVYDLTIEAPGYSQ